MNLPALSTYLYAGSIVALFLWFDLAATLYDRPAWHRALWCLLMLLTWPLWGLLAVGRAYDVAARVRRERGR